MSDRQALIDAFSDVNFSEWSEVQSFVEGAVADAILSSDWLAAHDAEKRAEWEAEQDTLPQCGYCGGGVPCWCLSTRL